MINDGEWEPLFSPPPTSPPFLPIILPDSSDSTTRGPALTSWGTVSSGPLGCV